MSIPTIVDGEIERMAERAERRCVRCNHSSGYNRAVIDLVSGVLIGSLCRRCELDELDGPLVAPPQPSNPGTQCDICDRDGLYTLPRWLPDTRPDGDILVTTVDYERDENPFTMCDEHYHRLVDGPATTSSGPVLTRDRR